MKDLVLPWFGARLMKVLEITPFFIKFKFDKGFEMLQWQFFSNKLTSTSITHLKFAAQWDINVFLSSRFLQVPTQFAGRQTSEDMALLAYNRALKLSKPGLYCILLHGWIIGFEIVANLCWYLCKIVKNSLDCIQC